MGNKRGSQIVEATIVLPVIILTILSMIMLLVFFFACLTTQMSVHQHLISKAVSAKTVIGVERYSKATSKHVGGVISILMKKDVSSSCYLINEVTAIRLGEAINEKDQ